MLFDPEISKTERKNGKKKKQATTKPSGISSSIDSPSPEIDTMAGIGGEGNRPPRRTLGDYAYQQRPKHYNNMFVPPFSNKVVELKPALLSLIGLHPFVGMDHEDPYTHFFYLHGVM